MSADNTFAGYNLERILSYDVDGLTSEMRSRSSSVVLFGAGLIARYALTALKSHDVRVDYVCDSDERKQGKIFCGYEITTLSSLAATTPDAFVLICSSSLGPMLSTLESLGFRNVFSCISIFERTNFSKLYFSKDDLKHIGTAGIDRDIQIYCLELRQFANKNRPDGLKLPIIDIVVTEACSMKCKDCSNLMQYYAHPKHCRLNVLFESIDKIMKSVDWVSEFRVIGGEPFLNKNIGKVIEKLLEYDNADKIVIYTNATIVPKGNNLQCLKNSRVQIDITNYGLLSRKYDELSKIFEIEGISYATKIPKWTDSGRILPCQQKSREQIEDLFFKCCTNDVFTLLHGKLYHCAFSAHAMNLKAIPLNGEDVIDVNEESEGHGLRHKIDQFYKKKNCLTACSYCSGRDYSTPFIEPAIQTKKPLPLPTNS